MSAGAEACRADPAFASRRYVDVHGEVHIKLLPKEFYVTDQPFVLTTVLGSCVAACLRDAAAGVAGMNHFMLPDLDGAESARIRSMVYGGYAMNRLIDALLAHGARRERLEAKVFGGANVLADMRTARIGDANADFVRDYLARARIPILAEDLGGGWPRQVQYAAGTGRARVRRLRVVESALAERERRVAEAAAPVVAGSSA
ncbi:chemoreceptor glutamine deamidase CheD [Salinisphaera sp. LB1]|uniref:chemoreceptor glutamine deamidase CheD n=1 Tax=Salinisphaera sp. LB1 TaxID=2183911 RepID=UPI000D705BC1|nr:chemoreceptor glutamine deamidase CheD [Salinisphaera sp. LB1]AWN16007.1 Chemotaxis protein CheD [Salinisphaera sp. LB1]